MNLKFLCCLLLITPMLLKAQKTVSINPNTADRGQNLPVSITGTQTNFSSGSNTLTFYYQGSPTSMVSSGMLLTQSNTRINTNLFVQASATLGAYTYDLFNFTDGVVTGTGNFMVGPTGRGPAIVSLTPPQGHLNQTLRVTVTGTLSSFTQGSPTLQLIQAGSSTSYITIDGYDVYNDTTLAMNLLIDNNARRGFYDFYFNNNIHYLVKYNAFEITWPIGLNETKNKEAIKVYPNPAKEQITIEAKAIKEVSVLDMQGRLVQTESLPEPTESLNLKLDPMILPKQYYLLKIVQVNGVYYHRFILE